MPTDAVTSDDIYTAVLWRITTMPDFEELLRWRLTLNDIYKLIK